MKRLPFVLLCSCLMTASATADTGSSFFDQFDSFDRSRWTLSHGWSNGEFQDCMWSKDNVRLEGGVLQLKLTRVPVKDKSYSCAEVQSVGPYGYGTYEIRIRPAKASGIVSTFFTYSGPPAFQQPHDEVDFEFLGRHPDKAQLNQFANGKSPSHELVDIGLDASASMNDYAFQWTPETLKWFVNGKLIREVKAKAGEHPTHPSKIIVMLWNSRKMIDWLGPFSDPMFPLTTDIDWIAYTKLGDPCQFPQSIVCTIGD